MRCEIYKDGKWVPNVPIGLEYHSYNSGTYIEIEAGLGDIYFPNYIYMYNFYREIFGVWIEGIEIRDDS